MDRSFAGLILTIPAVQFCGSTSEIEIHAAQSAREKVVRREKAERELELSNYQVQRTLRLSKMGDEHTVSRTFCRNVAWNATNWRIRGRIQRAFRDADHLVSGPYGWELPLGRNRWAVEQAVKWFRKALAELFTENSVRPFRLSYEEKRKLGVWIRAAVIAANGKLRDQLYPVDASGQMWLGNHAINLSSTVTAVLYFAGFE